MAVLIRQNKSSGDRRRVCSARCYNAKGDKCQCICDGKNHGIGLDKAIETTGELAKELIDKGFEPVPQTYFKEPIDAGRGQKGRNLLESRGSNLLYKWKSFWNNFRF